MTIRAKEILNLMDPEETVVFIRKCEDLCYTDYCGPAERVDGYLGEMLIDAVIEKNNQTVFLYPCALRGDQLSGAIDWNIVKGEIL